MSMNVLLYMVACVNARLHTIGHPPPLPSDRKSSPFHPRGIQGSNHEIASKSLRSRLEVTSNMLLFPGSAFADHPLGKSEM